MAATWLNFAPDHLDVHLDLDGYERAKAQMEVAMGGGGEGAEIAEVVAEAAEDLFDAESEGDDILDALAGVEV